MLSREPCDPVGHVPQASLKGPSLNGHKVSERVVFSPPSLSTSPLERISMALLKAKHNKTQDYVLDYVPCYYSWLKIINILSIC